MPAARYSADLVRHGVGGQRDDRVRRRPSGRSRSRISRAAVGAVHHRHLHVHQDHVPAPCSQASTASRRSRRPPARRRPAQQGLQHQLVDRHCPRPPAPADAPRRRPGRPARAGGRRFGARTHARSSGSVTVKVEPIARRGSRPRFARPSARPARGRSPGPGPVPPKRRVVEASAWSNFSNSAASCLRRNADAGVAHRQMLSVAVARPMRDLDLAVLGELQRVGDQVVQHLAHPRGVAPVDPRRLGSTSRSERQALLAGERCERRGRRPPARRRGRTRASSSSSLPASIFERSSTSLRIASSASPDCADHRPAARAAPAAGGSDGHRLGHAQHAVQRRADLVAHGGQEGALGVVGGLGLFLGLDQRPLGLLARGDVLHRADHAAHLAVVARASPASPRRSRTPRRCRAARGTRSRTARRPRGSGGRLGHPLAVARIDETLPVPPENTASTTAFSSASVDREQRLAGGDDGRRR